MISKMSLVFFAGFVACCINEYGVSGETTTREPSIQAYGLPKRISTGNNNGYIERIHVGENVGSKASRSIGDSSSSGVRRKFGPSTITTNSHDDRDTIEIFHPDSMSQDETVFSPRSGRSIVDGDDDENVSNDLRAEETKVFRPLFVYRQQVLRRQRSDRERRNNVSSSSSSPRSNKKSEQQLRHRLRSG